MDEITTVQSRLERLEGMLDEMMELGRMRSDFTLRHFVVGQHDKPGRQRAQALAELQGLYFSLADVYDDLELTKIELDEKEGEDKRAEIERRKLRRKIVSMTMHLTQRVKEIDCLLGILDELPKYTAESLEAEEREYWAMRLTRQAYLAGRDPGGNVDALLQMATIAGQDKPAMPLGPHDYLLGLGLDVNEIAVGLKRIGLISEEGAKKLVEANTPVAGKRRRR
jgi:hypothetical protein